MKTLLLHLQIITNTGHSIDFTNSSKQSEIRIRNGILEIEMVRRTWSHNRRFKD